MRSELQFDRLVSELKAARLAFVVLPPDYRHLAHLFMTTRSDQDDLDLSILCYRNVEDEKPVADDWLGVQFHWQRSRDSLPLVEIDLYKVALLGFQATENRTFATFWLSGNIDHTFEPRGGCLDSGF